VYTSCQSLNVRKPHSDAAVCVSRVAEAVDDDRVVGALERAHALTLEHSMLSDAPETSWQTIVVPALQVLPVPF